MLRLAIELPPGEYLPGELNEAKMYCIPSKRSARTSASGAVVNSSVLMNSSLDRPLKDSAKLFSKGDPGSMYAVLVSS